MDRQRPDPREMSDAQIVAYVKEIVRRGWSNHMWNFENMCEGDESWLRILAGIDQDQDTDHERAYTWSVYAAL